MSGLLSYNGGQIKLPGNDGAQKTIEKIPFCPLKVLIAKIGLEHAFKNTALCV